MWRLFWSRGDGDALGDWVVMVAVGVDVVLTMFSLILSNRKLVIFSVFPDFYAISVMFWSQS